jgi:hypothetical protein
MFKKLTVVKVLLLTILAFASSIASFAQAPQAIPYQGVARNAAGNILASQPIGLLINIHDVTSTGTIVYSETQAVTTSTLGLFTVNIGAGTPVTGTLAGVNWGTGAKFIQVEMDATGGTDYVNMGTTQLMSVPYALFAGNGGGSSGNVPPGTAIGNTIHWNGSAWVADNTIYNDGTKVGIGNITPNAFFNVAPGQTVLFGTDSTSAENKLMWLPTKGAFRAGRYLGSTNDPIGNYSTAMGSSTASGNLSTAMGGSLANAEFSTATGGSVANGVASTAMGASTANGDYSTAMGNTTLAKSVNETVIGTYNDTSNTNRLFEIGDGTPSVPSNALTVLYNGMVGIGTVNPNATFNVAEGQTVLFGTDTTSQENKLMWLPTKGAFRTGYYWGPYYDGLSSFSTAMGYSYANGSYSTALGYGQTTADYATAMGQSGANAEFSTAMGNSSARGEFSTAMNQSIATANYSTTMGKGTTALSENETVIGTYNYMPSTNNRLFEIGNGTSRADLSNAFTVLNNGDVYIGTSNPTIAAKLVVQGNENGNISSYDYYSYSSGNTSVVDGVAFDETAPLSIWASDRISASEFDATSDMRIKRDIKPLPNNSLDIVTKINVVSYAKFSRGGISKEIGVIGQELEKVLPEAVKKGDGDVYNDTTQKWDPVKDFRTVNYQTIGMLTTKAVQELNKKVDGQQAMVEALQKQNTALQQNNLELQQQMQTLLNTVASLNKQVQALAAKTTNQNTVAVNK